MNAGASTGRIPENVFVRVRAMVTAGFANDVDAVHQYAPVMYAPTAKATAFGCRREQPQMTDSRPKVATNSLNACENPARSCNENSSKGFANMTCALATPTAAPAAAGIFA